MRVIVDTCIWSQALRKSTKKNQSNNAHLSQLAKESRIMMIGAIRQEVLSGIKHEKQFDKLKSSLACFPDLVLQSEDYELAAKLYNQLRSKGIQGSNTDFLICAVAINYQLAIFTDDKDFDLFSQHLPLQRYMPF